MLDTKIEEKIINISLETRKIFDDGDAIFKQKRQGLDLDSALDTDNYLEEVSRKNCLETLKTYFSQLNLEKQFYEKTSAQFLHKLTQTLAEDVRVMEEYKVNVLPRIMEGCQLRAGINSEKTLAISKAVNVINIFEEISSQDSTDKNLLLSAEKLCTEIDEHIENQYNLAQKQRQNDAVGKTRLKEIIQGHRNA